MCLYIYTRDTESNGRFLTGHACANSKFTEYVTEIFEIGSREVGRKRIPRVQWARAKVFRKAVVGESSVSVLEGSRETQKRKKKGVWWRGKASLSDKRIFKEINKLKKKKKYSLGVERKLTVHDCEHFLAQHGEKVFQHFGDVRVAGVVILF